MRNAKLSFRIFVETHGRASNNGRVQPMVVHNHKES